MNVMLEVQLERERQEIKWGGPSHDDTHNIYDWLNWILSRTKNLYFNNTQYMKTPRKIFIEIAALAIAAIESTDRLKADGKLPDDLSWG